MTLKNYKKLNENEKITDNFTCKTTDFCGPDSSRFENAITYS